MANRKVLINRHSTKNLAPSASEMFHGEIAVSHPEGLTGLSATTIWTRNNDTMVPFASCAMTMQMIDNAIAAADVTYDVKAAQNEAHVDVATGGTASAKEFTVSSKDVMSEEEFKAYSARTAEAVEELMNMLITAVTGEGVIEVEPETTGATGYNIKHKEAKKVALGFNKVTTDDYGHVIDYSAVTADDINAVINVAELSAATKALSAGTQHDIETLSGNVVEYVKVVSGNIETVINELSANTMAGDAAVFASAKTYTDEAIGGLDSEGKVSAAGKYLTGIGIANGKISGITEADLPTLTKVVSGAGNVFTDIEVNDHEIVINKGITVASDADLQALSGATVAFSGATDAKFAELSGATVAEFNSVFTAIQAMDKDADPVAGQVVTTVSEADGVVSETKANVKDLQLGGYVKDTAATGDIASADTINAALSKLENKAAAITIANADKSINVTAGATGTDINVNIKSGEKVLAKDGAAGLYTDLDLVKITTGLPATVKERYQLLATDDSQIGVNIDVPKDSHIVSINYISDPADAHYQNLEYKYIDAEGTEQTTYVDVSSLVLEAEFASGVTVTNHIAHGVVDPDSETFLTVGGAGFKLSGVQNAIDAKVNALDVTGDTAAAGKYVAAIEQTDGVVAVKTRANVSEAVLNNYAKESDASAVAATDTINQAISKLENQVDAAKAAATTKVVEGTDAGNNMTITSATSATDGSVTYTVNLTDVASKAALDAEIAARKAVDGQNGDTYAANSNANYISEATSLNDADVKLDAAIKAEETARIAAIEALDSVGSASTTGHYLTSVTITDGLISAVGEVAIPAAVPVTTASTTTATTASSVVASVVPGGTDGHQLTLNMTNKVYSAATADEAVKVKSALTINILDSAGTTASTVTFDGSSNQTIEIPGSHDTATTETGHYAPSTTASSLDAAAGTVLNKVTLDSKNHVISAGTTDKINSASTAESADTASKVNNALSISGYATSESSALDSAVSYDGSAAQSLTFGKDTAAGKSMSFSNGVVDVEIIDCGEY